MTRRLTRVLLRIVTVLGWWWLMMAVHELGHVLGCLVSGATVESVSLWPWTLSQTVRSGSGMPLVDTWAGPVVGVLLPALLWVALRRTRAGMWLGGWAGFCLIANGVYIGCGWIDGAGDAGDLARLGVAWWLMLLVGMAAVAAGLAIWHALTRRSVASGQDGSSA